LLLACAVRATLAVAPPVAATPTTTFGLASGSILAFTFDAFDARFGRLPLTFVGSLSLLRRGLHLRLGSCFENL
jgi:hypothetical protein